MLASFVFLNPNGLNVYSNIVKLLAVPFGVELFHKNFLQTAKTRWG